MKIKRQAGVDDTEKTRLNVRISQKAQKRLGIHSVMSGQQPGEIVEELIIAHCRDWKVSVNVVSRHVIVDSAIEAHGVDLSCATQA